MAAVDQPATTTKLEAKTKFTWKIESFSSKLQEAMLCSDIFIAGGHRWIIRIYPYDDALSLYLRFAGSEKMEGQGWSVHAPFTLTIVGQLDASFSLKLISGKDNFDKVHDSWGCERFVELDELQDPSHGFLVNDTLVVQAEVSTEAAAAAAEATANNGEAKGVVTPASSKQNGATSTVESASRNLIAQLSAMTISSNGLNPDHASDDLLQQQREKLVGFLGMSLEAICQTESCDEVKNIALQVAENASDPIEKVVLKDLTSRLAELKKIVSTSLSTIETSSSVELSVAQMSKDMESMLVHRKTQLSSLEAEVSRLGEEDMKLEAEMQQLAARRAEIADQRNSTVVELEKASREASKEVEELKKQYGEREQAIENRMIAKDRLARSNTSWKLFKENLGW